MPRLKDSLQSKWPVLFRNIRVSEDEDLQVEGDERDISVVCHSGLDSGPEKSSAFSCYQGP